VSNAHTTDQDGNWPANGNGFANRREVRANNPTGAIPAIGGIYSGGRGYSGAFDFEALLTSLHDLFERDRQIASQQDATRCGICYLYFPLSELQYRAEGFYICHTCATALGDQPMPMLRNQQIIDL
jgi:hypothetical protein